MIKPYYQDGSCTLYHGDCLEIIRELGDNSIDMIFTDPPYGHNNNNNGDLISRWEAALGCGDYVAERDNIPIANDGVEANDIFKNSLPEWKRILIPGACCCCCCCGGGGPEPTFAWVANRLDREGFDFFHAVVWDKSDRGNGLGWRYRRNYEFVMVANKNGSSLSWSNKDVAIPNIIRITPPIERVHPNEKPVGLVCEFVKVHTYDDDMVLDPFMGSGTTGVACVRLNRRFIGIEISKEYCDIAVERIKRELSQPRLELEPQPSFEQTKLFDKVE